LDVARRAYTSVPAAETGAGHIVVERQITESLGLASEDMPVPNIKEFGAELDAGLLRKPSVLEKSQVVIMVAEPSQVRDARSLTVVEVKAVRALEGRFIE